MKPQVNSHKRLQQQLLYLHCMFYIFKIFWHSADCHKGNVQNVQICTQNCAERKP